MGGGGGGGAISEYYVRSSVVKGRGVAAVFIDILLSLLVASGGVIWNFLSRWGWHSTMPLFEFCLSVVETHLSFSCVGQLLWISLI